MKFASALTGLLVAFNGMSLCYGSCPSGTSEVEVDFERDPSGSRLGTNEYIEDQFLDWNFKVEARRKKNGSWNSGNFARLFDSANPTGGDTDLGTPNRRCPGGGPGVSSNDNVAKRSNCSPKGKVLIIEEKSLSSEPDDNMGGGMIEFIFLDPVERVLSVEVLDIEGSSSGNRIQLKNNGGSTMHTKNIVGAGDNTVQYFDMPETNNPVKKIRIDFRTSGAVTSFKFCSRDVEEAPPNPNVGPHCGPNEEFARMDWIYTSGGLQTYEGQWVSDDFEEFGFKEIAAYARPSRSSSPDRSKNVARMFDTQNPVGDRDLGAPNQNCPVCRNQGFIDAGLKCTGSGKDNNLAAQSNCFFQGNVLIIDENGDNVPDDNADGGEIEIKFGAPITRILSIEVMDIESSSGNTVALYDKNGREFEKETIVGLGDNTCQMVTFNDALTSPQVGSLKLTLKNSGSINNIAYCYSH